MTVYRQQSNACTLPPSIACCHCCHLAYHAPQSLWGVIALALKYTDKRVLSVSQPGCQSVHVHCTEMVAIQLLTCCCRCMALSSRLGGESSSQHGCHRSIKLQSTELGVGTLARCWFIPESICLHGWHVYGHEHEWSYTGYAARSLIGYPAVFYNPAPLLEPVKMVNGTGYRNWIFNLLVLLPWRM